MSTWGVYGITTQDTAPGKRHVVRWRVDGGSRQKSFPQRGYAKEALAYLERARALRWAADDDGWPIDPAVAVREPVPSVTFAAYAEDWFLRHRLRWAPGGRDAHEAALRAARLLLRLTDDDPRYDGRADRSIRLAELTLTDLERAIGDRHLVSFGSTEGREAARRAEATGRRVEVGHGKPSMPRTVQAFVITLGMVVKTAQAEGLVSANLWSGVRGLKVSTGVVSELRQVPSRAEVLALAQAISELGPKSRYAGHFGARLRAAVLLCGTSGLRPGEATDLRTADVHLESDKPFVVVRGTARRLTAKQAAMPAPDTLIRDGWSERPLKHRQPGATRHVPIDPAVVEALRDHDRRFAGSERWLVSPRGDTPLDWGNLTAAYWRPACEAVFQGDREFLATMPPKTLRKAALTDMLARGVNPYVVAAVAGHDPATLLSHYAGVIDQRDLHGVFDGRQAG